MLTLDSKFGCVYPTVMSSEFWGATLVRGVAFTDGAPLTERSIQEAFRFCRMSRRKYSLIRV